MKKYGIPAVLFLAFFALWFLLTRGATAPLIYPDEAGYIGWARTFAGIQAEVWRYLPGYGLFLSPIFWFTNELTTAFQAIVFLNCLMGAGIVVLFYAMLQRVSWLDGKKRLLCAVAAGLYPAWMLYGNLALCEVWLAFLYTVLLWAVSRWDRGKRYGILTLICCVWLVATHGRGGAAVIGVGAAFGAYAWDKPWKKRAVQALLGAGGVGLVLAILYLATTKSVNGGHLREQVLALFSLDGIWNTVSTLLSQSYYLVLSTFGVAVLGVVRGIRLLRKKNDPVIWFVLITFLCTALLSALFMNHHEKPDHLLYGRYNEFALGGILLLGVTSLFKKRPSAWWAVGLFFGLALFTNARYGQELIGIDANLCHTFGLYFYKILFSQFTFWGVAAWFGLFGGMMYLIRRYNPVSALLFLCALFLATSLYTKYDYFYKGASPRYQPSQLEQLVKDETGIWATKLQGDSMGYSWGVYHLLTSFPQLSLQEEGELRLSSERIPNGALLGSERYDRLYLYAGNEEAAKRYEKQQLVVGDNPTGAVSLEETSGGNLKVLLENTGSPWLSYEGAEVLSDCVRVLVSIFRDGAEIDQFRLDLHQNMYAGDKLLMDIPLSLPDGYYRVQISPVVDLRKAIASLCLNVEIQGRQVMQAEEREPIPVSFSQFQTEAYPRQTTGMFRGYSTGKTQFTGLGWQTEQSYLTVKSKGTHPLRVWVNGQELREVSDRSMTFSLEGITQIDQIRLESDVSIPARLANLPSYLRFLRADSPCKPISLFVRGMDKLFGMGWDFTPYGIWLERIELVDER